MLLAIRCRLAALEIEVWSLHARGMQASHIADVYHAVVSMFPAVRRHLATLDVKVWSPRAGVI